MDKVIAIKIESLERCLKRIEDKYDEVKFSEDFDIQDIVVLNLQRACEQCIDVAHRLLKIKKLGLPKDSAEAFTALAEAGIIEMNLATQLKKMVGFRNVAVHDYTNMNLDVVKFVVKYGTLDIKRFINTVIVLEY
jgi:uncharacterized protein YutE (UPF0331/DUF86 family)